MSRYEGLQRQLEDKLRRLEDDAQDKNAFWLKHNRLLLGSEREKLEFLYPGGLSPISPILSPNLCEECGEEGVTYELVTDTYICGECGLCQEQIRHKPLRFIPESCIYKHHVHLHQILHEMQCLRRKLPDGIVDDVRHFLKEDFSYERIKKSLRQLGYKQHYSMVYSIQAELDETFTPLRITKEEEEQLQGLFHQYIALGPMGGKKNRLNYHFVLSKLAKMCHYDHILPYLHPPKGKKSIESSEKIWREVCRRICSMY
ncbi:MAG: hypothetical protein ACXWVU_00745 [Sulfuricurvum sp.]